MNETWLAHHGIKNMKWGIRRFQNPDGSLTSAGRQRYGVGSIRKDGYQESKKPFGSRIDGYQKQSKPGKVKYKIGDKMNDNDPNDSSITRRAKKEYNNLSDDEFKRKYQVSKNTYRKRVNKYGDPYMNSPLAKAGKSLSKRKGKDPDKVAEDELNGSVARRSTSNGKKAAKIVLGTMGALALIGGAAAATMAISEGKKHMAEVDEILKSMKVYHDVDGDWSPIDKQLPAVSTRQLPSRRS